MAQGGYIFKHRGSWHIRYRDNFMENGQTVRRQKCVKLAEVSSLYRRKSDLADLAAETLAAVRMAEKCPRAAENFSTYVEQTWLPWIERTKKPSTCEGYRGYWKRYIKPRVGDYALRDFTMALVSRMLEDIAKAHQVNVETIGKVRSILQGIFTYAMAKGDYPGRTAADNPASGAMIPEQATTPQPTVAATRDDVKAILAHLDTETMSLERAAIAIVAYTGVRPGEARGLRWEEWDRGLKQLAVRRSVWRTHEGTPKTPQSNRFVAVTEELRNILLALWNERGCPIAGYILARSDGGRVNLDNMSKRDIIPALAKKGIAWHGWYSLRRFHGTEVRKRSSSDTMSKALGNSKEVADAHYLKLTGVLPDVRRAVNGAFRGLTTA